jgi:HAD superfamily hydrolase (TIGR01509 family)
MTPGLSGLPVKVLLCDADGCLFPSEAPAFESSAEVTNDLLAEIGSSTRFGAEELRLATTGQNFRTTAAALVAAEGRRLGPAALEHWVKIERRAVTAHLGKVLKPDPLVIEPLERLAVSHALAVVTSSARSRLDACLAATGLDGLFPPERLFSAESSLPVPAGKPDPAIYMHTLEQLGVRPREALAVEDSAPGATAAVRADCPTVGNLTFVPLAERPRRRADLEAAGVLDIVSSWDELEVLLESIGAAKAGVGR